MRKAVAMLSLGLTMVVTTGGVASANDVVETNVVERVECLFKVDVTEGGEQGLDCLA